MSKYEMYDRLNDVVYFDGTTEKCEYYNTCNHCGTCMYNSGHFLDTNDTTDQGRCTAYKAPERNAMVLIEYYDNAYQHSSKYDGSNIIVRTINPETENRDFEIDVKRQFYKYVKGLVLDNFNRNDRVPYIDTIYTELEKRFRIIDFAEVFDFDYFLENINLETDGKYLSQTLEYKGCEFICQLPIPDEMVI